jgi:hypothetical protein
VCQDTKETTFWEAKLRSVDARHERHMEEPQGGARVVDRWTRVTRRKGFNTPLTSRILGIHRIRARELSAITREVVSCMKCEGKVNPH